MININDIHIREHIQEGVEWVPGLGLSKVAKTGILIFTTYKGEERALFRETDEQGKQTAAKILTVIFIETLIREGDMREADLPDDIRYALKRFRDDVAEGRIET